MARLGRGTVFHMVAVTSAVGLGLLLGAAPAAGADCCFTNSRFGGPCVVTPSSDETCSSILAFLNGVSTVGRAYCGNTTVRGGWRQTDCAAVDATAGSLGTLRARPAELYTAPSWSALPSSRSPASPQPLVVSPGSRISVSMVGDFDLAKTAPGTSFAARLQADLMVDGDVAAPAGSPVYGRLVQAQGQAQPVLELTDVEVGGAMVPVVADATSQAAVGLPVMDGVERLGKGEVVAADPTVRLLLTGDVAGAMDLTRATIAVRRQQIVAASLQLSEAEGEAFWPLFRDYRTAVEKVGAREAALITDFAARYGDLDDAQARALLDAATSAEADRLKLKQQYVKRFAKILPGVTLARFFQVENKLDAVIRMELAAGIPLVR